MNPRGFLIGSILLGFVYCAEKPVDVCGHWKGQTEINLDGEDIVQSLELDLSKEGEDINGHFCWSNIEKPMTSVEIKGNDVLLKSEWNEGSFILRGLVIGNTFKGRYSYEFVKEREPYTGKFEITRDPTEGV